MGVSRGVDPPVQRRSRRRQAATIAQIAIDPAMDLERQRKMFDHFVPFTTLEDLPLQITQILKKAIK